MIMAGKFSENFTRILIQFSLLVWGFLLPLYGAGQKSKIIKWDKLQNLLDSPDDSLTVINFWATWCRPCVKEIPHFESLRKTIKNKALRFRYISLDFIDEKQTRLDPFVAKNMKGAHVWLLDETDYNAWIDKLDKHWAGGIPVTLFFNNAEKKRKFVDSELSEAELNQILKTLL
jgi:thiol-disulfide isomerase/thioredoxin